MAYDRWGDRREPPAVQDAWFEDKARRLGLPFDAEASGVLAFDDAEGVGALHAAIRRGNSALASGPDGSRLLLAPSAAELETIDGFLHRHPQLHGRIAISRPSAIRTSLIAANGPALVDAASEGLNRAYPELSAKRLFSSGQRRLLAISIAASAFTLWRFGTPALLVFDLLAGLIFLALIVLRALAISVVLDRTARPKSTIEIDRVRLPTYTILVALYDEAHMVGELVQSLKRIDWPADRLDIKLVVEARDLPTQRAIIAERLPGPFEMVVVPDHAPRTKPKALAFALPLSRGEFVTVYDAEDRPDPGQLLEAYAAFSEGDDKLACVQAPLLIENASDNGLTALFAMEYAVQFDGVLPMLSALGLPLPLGGTSNHFRRAALEAVGGWDPYNVTEDADLGVRLARFGYRSATISCPTYEEAPAKITSWLRQRTRWLKGWLQTCLVHTRHPRRLIAEIGLRRAAGFLLTGLGSVIACAMHPIYLATTIVLVVDPSIAWSNASPLGAAFIFLNVFNFIAGYVTFAVLVRAVYRFRGISRPRGALRYLPCYWLLLAVACYRALLQLIVAPHRWEKTRHVGRRSRRARLKRAERLVAAIPAGQRAR